MAGLNFEFSPSIRATPQDARKEPCTEKCQTARRLCPSQIFDLYTSNEKVPINGTGIP